MHSWVSHFSMRNSRYLRCPRHASYAVLKTPCLSIVLPYTATQLNCNTSALPKYRLAKRRWSSADNRTSSKISESLLKTPEILRTETLQVMKR